MKSRNPWSRSVLGILAAGVAVGLGSTAVIMNASPKRGTDALASVPISVPATSLTREQVNLLQELDDAFANLAEQVRVSVVHIRADGGIQRDAQSGRMMRQAPEGSGVIYRSDGYIITNDHVVAGQQTVTVTLSNGRKFSGRVISSNDRQADIAVVKIDADNLPAARFADSSQVRPGQFAVAVGAPFGLDQTITVGHVSALGRQSAAGDPIAMDRREYSDLIQTDAPINQGNSGGPLVNIDGEVIGINSTILATGFGGGSTGIGFAIPANQARLVADILIRDGKLNRGFMGVAPRSLLPYEREEKRVAGGAVVEEVVAGGPAERAGLRQGDIVQRIGDHPVRGEQDLRDAMLKYGPNAKVEVEVLRDGSSRKLEVTLGAPEPFAANSGAGSGSRRPMPMPDFDIPEFREFFDRNRTQDRENVPPLREGNARLGVQVEDLNETVRKQFNLPNSARGVVVKVVEPGSFAERQGIRPGDVITTIDGKRVEKVSDLVEAMQAKRWGDSISLQVETYTSSGMSSVSIRTQLR